MPGIARLDQWVGRAATASVLCGILAACRPAGSPTEAAPTPTVPIATTPTQIPPTASMPAEATPTEVTPATEVIPTQPDASVAPGAPPPREGAPRAEISLSATALKVGDSLTVTGTSINIGLEKFTLTLSSGGVIETTYENATRIVQEDSLFEVVSVKGQSGLVTAVLTARQPGTSLIRVSISGEVHEGYPGPAYWSSASSEEVEVTVVK